MTISKEPNAPGGPLTLRAVAPLLTVAILTSGCATTGGSANERAICAELRASLPSWSSADTVQSRSEGADFLDVFAAICPE